MKRVKYLFFSLVATAGIMAGAYNIKAQCPVGYAYVQASESLLQNGGNIIVCPYNEGNTNCCFLVAGGGGGGGGGGTIAETPAGKD